MEEPPAYSELFLPDRLQPVEAGLALPGMTREWAWGGSRGAGIKIAILDTGIDATHPAVGGVAGYVAFEETPDGVIRIDGPHEDDYGHGTACAAIIRALAPQCELYSVKVLRLGLAGIRLMGKGKVFAAGLRWALDRDMQVCNLSLGTTRGEFAPLLHELADAAHHRGVMLVAAANNDAVPSYPSLFGSVISVAAHGGADPFVFYANPSPPVEFGARGIDVRVAWRERRWNTVSGNSFAAPHLAGIVALILAKHPRLTVYEMKTVLRALAANAR